MTAAKSPSSRQGPSSGRANLVGVTIGGRYRIDQSLGSGGMAAVYAATHTLTDRRVALKVIHPEALEGFKSDERLLRFEREARATGRLDSPHIAQVFDAGHDDERGTPFLAMELLNGEDLRHFFGRVGALKPSAALALVGQACEALVVAHRAGVVHRDIKPGNLFLQHGAGGRVTVKLVDFGIAKLVFDPTLDGESSELTRTGSLLGTPHYMSPEQAQALKSVDHRTDIWSLGVVLFKMLTGRTPFDDATTMGQVVVAICTRPAPPLRQILPEIDAPIAAIVDRALAHDPAERFATAREMLDAIELAAQGSFEITLEALESSRAPLAAMPKSAAGAILRGPGDIPTAVTVRGSDAVPVSGHSVQSATLEARTPPAQRGRRALMLGLAGVILTLGAAALLVRPDRASELRGSIARVAASTANRPRPVPESPSTAAVTTTESAIEPAPVTSERRAHRPSQKPRVAPGKASAPPVSPKPPGNVGLTERFE